MYIEINLLPQAFRPKRRLIKFDSKVALVLFVLIAFGGVGYYYQMLKKEVARYSVQVAQTKKQEAMLKDAVALNAELKEIRAQVAKRVSIIRDLTSGSDVRFVMLEHITSVLPENLWLMNISETEEGGVVSFNVEGMSYAKENISDFLAGLKKFEKFSSVALESIRPAPLEIKDAYNFVVKVSLVRTKPVEEEAPANARRRPRRR